MNRNLIIVITGYILIVFELIYLNLRSKKTVKEMGNCLFAFPKKNIWGMYGVDAVAALLLGILLVRDFGKLNIMFAAICVMSVYLITKENGNHRYYGVYEKGLIAPSYMFFYDDIMSFPVFELPLEEQEHYAKNTLVVVTKSKGKFEIIFESEEQRTAVVAKLTELGVIQNT